MLQRVLLLALCLLSVVFPSIPLPASAVAAGSPTVSWSGVQISEVAPQQCVVLLGIRQPGQPEPELRVHTYPSTEIRLELVSTNGEVLRVETGTTFWLDSAQLPSQNPLVLRLTPISGRCAAVVLAKAYLLDYKPGLPCEAVFWNLTH
jgi:hypothetical protein